MVKSAQGCYQNDSGADTKKPAIAGLVTQFLHRTRPVAYACDLNPQ